MRSSVTGNLDQDWKQDVYRRNSEDKPVCVCLETTCWSQLNFQAEQPSKAQSQMEPEAAAGDDDEDSWYAPQSLHTNISACQGSGKATDKRTASLITLSNNNLLMSTLLFNSILQIVPPCKSKKKKKNHTQ